MKKLIQYHTVTSGHGAVFDEGRDCLTGMNPVSTASEGLTGHNGVSYKYNSINFTWVNYNNSLT